jgi:tripartite-type tricarboxylate transporter receptor subunit TctC
LSYKKKLIVVLSTLYAGLINASEVVNVHWPFSPSSPQANMIRELLSSANNSQNQYRFVFQSKPGAGGTIAANATKDSPGLNILATTSSFYVRPELYTNSHNVNDFHMIGVVCENQPLGIYSKKSITLDILKNREFTMGVIQGSITNLLSQAMANANPNLKIKEVYYKGTVEASQDVLGGHIDTSIDLVGPNMISQFNNINLIGVTGKISRPGFPTLKSQGINGLDQMTVNYYIFVKNSVSSTDKRNLNKILNPNGNAQVQKLCNNDLGVVPDHAYESLANKHQEKISYWKKQTQGMAKDK